MPPVIADRKTAAERLAEAERIAAGWATTAERRRAELAARREAMQQARLKAAHSPTRGSMAAGWFSGWEREALAVAALAAALVRVEARVARAVNRVAAAKAAMNRAERLAPLKAQLIARANTIALAAPAVTKRWRTERKAESKKFRARAKELAKRLAGQPGPTPNLRRGKKRTPGEPGAVVGLPAAETWPTGPIISKTELAGEVVPPREGLLPGEYRLVGQLLDTPSGRWKPGRWTADYVGDRLSEAFRTLSRLPMKVRPNSFTAMWPQSVSGTANTSSVTAEDLSLMCEALVWPMEYLSHDTELARAVNAWALSTGTGRENPVNDEVRDGLLSIAIGLGRKKVDVR